MGSPFTVTNGASARVSACESTQHGPRSRGQLDIHIYGFGTEPEHERDRVAAGFACHDEHPFCFERLRARRPRIQQLQRGAVASQFQQACVPVEDRRVRFLGAA